MPKNLNYPLASFQKAFLLADAVDALGGNSSVENCAEKMQRKISGGFMVIISSAQKFNLVGFDKGMITISENYKLIKHAYTNTERLTFLKKAFLSPQVFSILFERFRGKELPVEMLDKILIREFEVEEITAGRIAGYFTDGLKTCGLLNGNRITDDLTNTGLQSIISEENNQSNQENTTEKENVDVASAKSNASFSTKNLSVPTEYYKVQLTGPGINTTLNLEIEEDVLILEAIIKKVRKSL
ncbi:MAG: hypothetical protein EOP42_06390 [Sphingobacteriaceae bacterium]|nr:MAG: hypothetical protein EOP42_06390 [Sphingobacteriaceae bacterium]